MFESNSDLTTGMNPDVTGGLHQIRTEVFLILGDLTAGVAPHRGRGITSAARGARHHALPPVCISDQTIWIRHNGSDNAPCLTFSTPWIGLADGRLLTVGAGQNAPISAPARLRRFFKKEYAQPRSQAGKGF
jgi:hypothetical protein